MKTKVTLTLEGGVTHRAKLLARERGTSLSRMVEALLSQETGMSGESVEKAPFSERWAGRFEPAERTEERYGKLAEKYGLGRER